MTIFELRCYDGRKSFYGKAHILEINPAAFILQSYDTKVCKIFWINGDAFFMRFWSSYSATTMRHVNSFLRHFGFNNYYGKKWWNSLPINTPIKL